MKFTERKLEEVFIRLLEEQGYPHSIGESIERSEDEVLIEEDLYNYLLRKYEKEELTSSEAKSIILRLKTLPSSDLYESNKKIIRWLQDGFSFKREDPAQKDIWIYLIDYENQEENTYRFVNQLEIVGTERRIPDGILYINGLPVVVFEFKSAIREEATIYTAYRQLTVRYKRDIPELFKYNAFCIISDGINNIVGSFFAPYEFFYAWRRIGLGPKELQLFGEREGDKEGDSSKLEREDREGNSSKLERERGHSSKLEQDAFLGGSLDTSKLELRGAQERGTQVSSLDTLIRGILNKSRLVDVIQNFIFFPDTSKKDEKIVCRYPQYYGARALFNNIKKAQKPQGDGKGGTYFGATGSGKSYIMLFLTRLLMKSTYFENPTIVLITDRTDLDDQLSEQFANAKEFIGDNLVKSVESRAELRTLLQGRKSGGVFLTTIHKFTEDIELLTERTNVICISDEAHRSQTNLDQKVVVTEDGVRKSYGFARYLHDSLPNATYVGFTGTPIDKTLDVFGGIVDEYTMTESVADEITVRIVYEGRAAKIILQNSELQKIEDYYIAAEQDGANEYQIDKSKRQTASMYSILGDPDRLDALARDFIQHYETRLKEGSTVAGKAMFVSSSREIAYDFYKKVRFYLGSRLGPNSSSYSSNINNPDSSSYSSSLESTENPSDYSSDYSQYFTRHFGQPEEWHRGKLPHRNRENLVQFITFRLADSLPQSKLQEIEQEIKYLSKDDQEVERRKKLQYWLDQGLGACSLAKERMAEVILDALFYHDGKKYDLLAWSIMPNHVHVLIRATGDLVRIIQSWKSFTGRWAMKNNEKYNLGIKDDAKQFWMSEYWDRFIRNEEHFNNTVRYTLNNPKKARLPENHIAYMFTGHRLSDSAKQELLPAQVRMVMTRHKDDPKEMYDLLGTKDDRKELERQFKDINSNFKVAIVVDMWLTGFDVPFLDTIYIDKPIREHNLIQTISRVNRKFKGKEKGLVVDYIGIKKQMNLAMAKYTTDVSNNFEDIEKSLVVMRNHLDLLANMFHKFDSSRYFIGSAIEQLDTLNLAAEYVQQSQKYEKRFMDLVKRLKAAYDICSGSEDLKQDERDHIHFYLAVRTIVFKLTKGDAPDTEQMNAKVREMIKDALQSDGVEEILKLGEQEDNEHDLFSEDYLAKLNKIKLPNTKIKLLQKLLARAIGQLRKVNKVRGVDFTKKMENLVSIYNDRSENDVLISEVYEDMADQLTDLIWEVYEEYKSGDELGIGFEVKAFYDILKDLCAKYDFTYPDDKMIELAGAVKELVDNQTRFPDWNKRKDIKSALKVGLILLLDEYDYPPVERDEVYEEIFEQAENFKMNR